MLGAAAEPGAEPSAAVVLQRPAILVMGNEGYGVRGAVRRLCDATLQVGARACQGRACTSSAGRKGRAEECRWGGSCCSKPVPPQLPSQPCPSAAPPLVLPRPQIEDSPGRHTLVDSLNVSVATGILLHRLLTAQGSGAAAAAPEAGGSAAAAAAAAEAAATGAPEL